jgi:hypothetical protein
LSKPKPPTVTVTVTVYIYTPVCRLGPLCHGHQTAFPEVSRPTWDPLVQHVRTTYKFPLYHVCCTCFCLCARLLATTSVLILFVFTYAVCPSANIPMCLRCILCSHCDTSVQLCPSLYSSFGYYLFIPTHRTHITHYWSSPLLFIKK